MPCAFHPCPVSRRAGAPVPLAPHRIFSAYSRRSMHAGWTSTAEHRRVLRTSHTLPYENPRDSLSTCHSLPRACTFYFHVISQKWWKELNNTRNEDKRKLQPPWQSLQLSFYMCCFQIYTKVVYYWKKKRHVCTWWLPNILTACLHLSEWNHATSLHFLKRSGGASYSTCVWGIFSESEGEPVVPFACKPPIPHTRGPAEVWKPFSRLCGSLRPWKTTPKSRWHSSGRTSLSLILCWK